MQVFGSVPSHAEPVYPAQAGGRFVNPDTALPSLHVGPALLAGVKSRLGGELHAYATLLSDTRTPVREQREASADAIGADAIVGTLMMSADIGQPMADIHLYGTAVKLK